VGIYKLIDLIGGINMTEEKKDLKIEKTEKIEGTFKQNREPKIEDTATDVYYKTKCKLPDSNVAIPTEDSVKEAKDWVDDENKM